MDEKELKTSGLQRFFIILIAVLMLGSMVASYIAIVLGNSKNLSSSSDEELIAKMAEYEREYNQITTEMEHLSQPYFDKLVSYKKEVKGYNETAANDNGVKTKDYEEGTGRSLTDNDTDYLAYYIGWCPDETVFDSSFDDASKPTKLKGFLDVANILPIDGWLIGMDGAKIGGVREITIPADLAYKEQDIGCGTYKPIKFIILTVARDGEMKEIAEKAADIEQKINEVYEIQLQRSYQKS